jgi:hypothetical protein
LLPRAILPRNGTGFAIACHHSRQTRVDESLLRPSRAMGRRRGSEKEISAAAEGYELEGIMPVLCLTSSGKLSLRGVEIWR